MNQALLNHMYITTSLTDLDIEETRRLLAKIVVSFKKAEKSLDEITCGLYKMHYDHLNNM